jgi:hypothetical protein
MAPGAGTGKGRDMPKTGNKQPKAGADATDAAVRASGSKILVRRGVTPFRQAAAVTMVWLGAFGLSAYTFAQPGADPSDTETLVFALLSLVAFPLVAWFAALSKRAPVPTGGSGSPSGPRATTLARDLAEMEKRLDALGARIQTGRRQVAAVIAPQPKAPIRPRAVPPAAAATIIDFAARRRVVRVHRPSLRP